MAKHLMYFDFVHACKSTSASFGWQSKLMWSMLQEIQRIRRREHPAFLFSPCRHLCYINVIVSVLPRCFDALIICTMHACMLILECARVCCNRYAALPCIAYVNPDHINNGCYNNYNILFEFFPKAISVSASIRHTMVDYSLKFIR